MAIKPGDQTISAPPSNRQARAIRIGAARAICQGASCSGEAAQTCTRVCRIAPAQHSAASISRPLPRTTARSLQSKPRGLNNTATPNRPSARPTAFRASMRSPSSSTATGVTHSGVVYARMAARPASTSSSAKFTQVMKATICSSPTDTITGRSRRVGRVRRPVAASTANSVAAPSVSRATANHIGGIWLSAIFIIGQLAPQRTTTLASRT